MNKPPSFDISEAYNWILYLNPEVHLDEYKLIKNASLDSYVLLQDIRASTGVKPQWLSVLPVLVDTKKMMGYRGSTCIQKLVSIELPPEIVKRLNKHSSRKLKWSD